MTADQRAQNPYLMVLAFVPLLIWRDPRHRPLEPASLKQRKNPRKIYWSMNCCSLTVIGLLYSCSGLGDERFRLFFSCSENKGHLFVTWFSVSPDLTCPGEHPAWDIFHVFVGAVGEEKTGIRWRPSPMQSSVTSYQLLIPRAMCLWTSLHPVSFPPHKQNCLGLWFGDLESPWNLVLETARLAAPGDPEGTTLLDTSLCTPPVAFLSPLMIKGTSGILHLDHLIVLFWNWCISWSLAELSFVCIYLKKISV